MTLEIQIPGWMIYLFYIYLGLIAFALVSIFSTHIPWKLRKFRIFR